MENHPLTLRERRVWTPDKRYIQCIAKRFGIGVNAFEDEVNYQTWRSVSPAQCGKTSPEQETRRCTKWHMRTKQEKPRQAQMQLR